MVWVRIGKGNNLQLNLSGLDNSGSTNPADMECAILEIKDFVWLSVLLASRVMAMSISSEKRAPSPYALDIEVPPLKTADSASRPSDSSFSERVIQ